MSAGLKVPISMPHCILLIGIINNGNPFEWTLITIINAKNNINKNNYQK